jgi:peptidoglycan/xylan/chitin deacetylase (PgdA/CDA1 family)
MYCTDQLPDSPFVFMFHRVGPWLWKSRSKSLCLPTTQFSHFLKLISAANLIASSLDTLPIAPQNAVFLTFDDGFADAFIHATPMLSALKMTAIQFLVADRIGQTNTWDLPRCEPQCPLMDRSQIRDWLAQGHEIGAHTLTHPSLSRLSHSQAREEIFSSKKKLEDMFGIPIRHFAYPYGDFNSQIVDLVQEAGFITAGTTQTGTLPSKNSCLLPRYPALARVPFHQKIISRLACFRDR